MTDENVSIRIQTCNGSVFTLADLETFGLHCDPHRDCCTPDRLSYSSMKIIPLTQGRFAMVDDEWFEPLSKHKWHFGGRGYAVRKAQLPDGKRVNVYMHREIAKTPESLFTDHINGNRTDNRSENLRHCTPAENRRNSKTPKTNRSGFKGVYWEPEVRKFRAQIRMSGGAMLRLGYFTNPKEAAAAYAKAATEHHGEFARP